MENQMSALDDLKVSVKPGVIYQSRYKFDASVPGKEWFCDSHWCGNHELAVELVEERIKDTGKSGKLIIVKRTYTEEIVGTYDITSEGTITPIRDQP